MPVLVALAGVLVVSAYVYWQQTNRPMLALPRVGSLAWPATSAEGLDLQEAGDLGAMLALDANRLLMNHPADRSMSAAECVIVPGPEAVGFMGIRRAAEGLIEEVAHWRVPGDDAAAVHEALLAKARDCGFSLLTPPRQNPTEASAVLGLSAPPRTVPHSPAVTQTLVLRSAARDGQIRIVAWLRYAMPVHP